MIHHADTLSIGLICALYIIFAVQLYWQSGWGALQAGGGRAVGLLVAVFVLCAFAGYGSSLLDQSNPIVWWIREWLHWMLIVATAWLVVTNQARVIARMLRDDRDR